MILRQRLTGLLASLAILGIVAGLPLLLITIDANPIPTALPHWDDVLRVLTTPDDGRAVIYVATLAAWLAWAFLAFSLLLEIIFRIRGIRAPRLPGLRLPQGLARGLVGAAAVLFTTAPLVAHAQPAAPIPDQPAHSASVTAKPKSAEHGGKSAAHKRSHVVKTGESLWSIAEKYLGDGDRYPEIAALNYGRTQPDGHHLTRQHWLNEGWVLKLPAEKPKPAATRTDVKTHTVRKGDTLWSIAEQTLGDGAKYPSIFNASKGMEQPGGYKLTDPDEISPGWTVVIPRASQTRTRHGDETSTEKRDTHRPHASQDTEAEPPVAPRTPTSALPTTQATTAAPAEPTAPPAAQAESQAPTAQNAAVAEEQDEAFPVRTASGVGALLAAGVISLVAARRVRQQRHRRHQTRLPMPTTETAHTEQQLRATADPLSVETVDAALRGLAACCAALGQPLPVVRAARLTPEQFDLYLAEDAALPEPWTGTVDATVWTLTSDAAADIDHANHTDVPAPYPALVTIGHDAEDSHIFLDLEHIAALGLTGDPDTCREVLAALAIELATSTWADDLQVTIVGAYPELEDALQTGRIRYVPTIGRTVQELGQRAERDRAALDLADVPDLQHARVTGAASDAWPPEIVLIAGALTEQQRTQLAELLEALPRVAIAAVTTDVALGEWRLDDLTPNRYEATLEPIGLTVRPQRIDRATYGHILDMVATASEDQVEVLPDAEPVALPAAGSTQISDQLAPISGSAGELDDGESSRSRPAPVVSDTCGPEQSPAVPTEAQESQEQQTAETGSATLLAMPGPLIRILGPVDLESATGTVEPSKRARLLEYAAYLALNPHATHSSIDDAIWPNRTSEDNLNTRNTATSKLRAWLGKDPNGEPYLPRHSYQLSDGVSSDWAEWLARVGTNPARAATSDLEQALTLVRGRPFEGVHPRRYAWAEPLRQEMISAIVDAAYELAHRRLMEGRWRAAEEAAALGVNLEPGIERIWRIRILAAHESRNKQAEKEAIDRMLIITDELESDLEPETVQLLADLKDPKFDFDALKQAL